MSGNNMKWLVGIFGELHSISLNIGETKTVQYKGEKAEVTAISVIEQPTIDNTGSGWLSIKTKYKDESRICCIAKSEPPSHRLEIGTRIKALREEKGLSYRQLSELCGITPQNILKIEHGRYSVGIDVLNKICIGLGARIEIQKGV